MIAIETKFHGSTNKKVSRVSAACCNCDKGGRVYVSYNPCLDSHDNHRAAAEAHVQKHHSPRLSVSVGYSLRCGYAFPLELDSY